MTQQQNDILEILKKTKNNDTKLQLIQEFLETEIIVPPLLDEIIDVLVYYKQNNTWQKSDLDKPSKIVEEFNEWLEK